MGRLLRTILDSGVEQALGQLLTLEVEQVSGLNQFLDLDRLSDTARPRFCRDRLAGLGADFLGQNRLPDLAIVKRPRRLPSGTSTLASTIRSPTLSLPFRALPACHPAISASGPTRPTVEKVATGLRISRPEPWTSPSAKSTRPTVRPYRPTVSVRPACPSASYRPTVRPYRPTVSVHRPAIRSVRPAYRPASYRPTVSVLPACPSASTGLPGSVHRPARNVHRLDRNVHRLDRRAILNAPTLRAKPPRRQVLGGRKDSLCLQLGYI